MAKPPLREVKILADRTHEDVKIDLRNLRRQSDQDIQAALAACGLIERAGAQLQYEQLAAVVQKLLVATAIRRAATQALKSETGAELGLYLQRRERVTRTKMKALLTGARSSLEPIFMAVECEADARVEYECSKP